MSGKQLTTFDDMNSSDSEKPFIGRYHNVLRRRKPNAHQLEKALKPEYKKKKIKSKMVFWLSYTFNLQFPLSQNHIYNIHNLVQINEHSLMDPDCEESFITSKFYVKKISKVRIQHNCLLLILEDLECNPLPIPYICQRLRSRGDATFARMANVMECLQQSYPKMQNKLDKSQKNLNQFLEEMKNKAFFSQYSANILILSNPFLNCLGYDVEEMAVESVKYKTIIKEFFSAASYGQIMSKHLQNIDMIKNCLQGQIKVEDICRESLIECKDYILNRDNVKIKCLFRGGISPQLSPYLEIISLSSDQEDHLLTNNERLVAHDRKMELMKDAFKTKMEMDILKQLIAIPEQMDPSNKPRMCSYKNIENKEQAEII